MDNKIKVAVYARVSTEHEAQLYALENQKDWYNNVLETHPEWELYDMYIDEGITGTSANKRPGFLRMIADAESGRFSLIITREVSRFARNTVDTLEYTRKLKRCGVEVFFVNDNIKTFDGDGELRLTIMATLAQDESRKTSIRVKAGQQMSMQNGVYYGNGNILGYDRVNGEYIINEEQAETVRIIYDLFQNGLGLQKIKYELEGRGILTATGRTNWDASNISRILHNCFYCGKIQYHKSFTPDFLEQKRKNNFGEIDKIIIDGSHTPIVTQEEFDKVQEIFRFKLATRKDCSHVETGTHRVRRKRINAWGDILECECGHTFNRRVWRRDKNKTLYAYQCFGSANSGSYRTRLKRGLSVEGICRVPMIQEWHLQLMADEIFRTQLNNTSEVLELTKSILEKHINKNNKVDYNEKLIEKKTKEKTKLEQRLEGLIEMRADGEIDKDTFLSKKESILSQIETITLEINSVQSQEPINENCGDRVMQLMNFLRESVEINEGEHVNPTVVKAFVKKIVVHENSFDWYFRTEDKVFKHPKFLNNKRVDFPTVYDTNTGCNQNEVGNVGDTKDYIEFLHFTISKIDADTFIRNNRDICGSRLYKYNELKVSLYI